MRVFLDGVLRDIGPAVAAEQPAPDYYSLTGYRLRLFTRLYFIIALLVPKTHKVDCRLEENK